MAKERLLRFHARYAVDLLYMHVRMAQLYLRFRAFTKRLELDRSAQNYSDQALTTDSETDASAIEMMTTHR